MKNDYLWDKTGNDLEIEKLENALQIFRLQENDAPEIPVNVLPFKRKNPRIIFPAFRAVAACFILVFVLTGLWFLTADSKKDFARKNSQNLIEHIEHKEIENVQNPNDFTEPEISAKETISVKDQTEKIDQKRKRQNFKVRKTIYKSEIKPQKTVGNNRIVKLTEEEKNAYDQLMLALSITSSKLKIVKDKALNTENQTAIYKSANTNERKK